MEAKDSLKSFMSNVLKSGLQEHSSQEVSWQEQMAGAIAGTMFPKWVVETYQYIL